MTNFPGLSLISATKPEAGWNHNITNEKTSLK